MRSSDANQLGHQLPITTTYAATFKNKDGVKYHDTFQSTPRRQGYFSEAHRQDHRLKDKNKTSRWIQKRFSLVLSIAMLRVIKTVCVLCVQGFLKNTDAVPLFIITKKKGKKKKHRVSFGNVLQYRERIRRLVQVSPLAYAHAPSCSVYRHSTVPLHCCPVYSCARSCK